MELKQAISIRTIHFTLVIPYILKLEVAGLELLREGGGVEIQTVGKFCYFQLKLCFVFREIWIKMRDFNFAENPYKSKHSDKYP